MSMNQATSLAIALVMNHSIFIMVIQVLANLSISMMGTIVVYMNFVTYISVLGIHKFQSVTLTMVTEQHKGSSGDGLYCRKVDLGNDNVSSNSLRVDFTKMYNDLNVQDECLHVHGINDIDSFNVNP